jgi:hypothetical protein
VRKNESRCTVISVSGPLKAAHRFVIVPVLAGLLAFLVFCAALRRAPLSTLLVAGAIGLGLHSSVLGLPTAITGPVARASASLRSWQNRTSARLACDIAQSHALIGDDPGQSDAACAANAGDAMPSSRARALMH